MFFKKEYLFLFVLSSFSLFCQEARLFNKLNSGLVEDDIRSVAVDKNGNKWIGTSNSGLVRYDNEKWETFSKNNSTIKGNYISSVFVDVKNNVWVSFSNSDGLAKYRNDKWVRIPHNNLGLKKLSVIDITEDSEGNIYIGGGFGAYKYINSKWSKLFLPEKELMIRTMAVSDNGDVAIGHNKGLLIYFKDKWHVFNEENSQLQLSVVRALKFTNDKLYIGYGGGLSNGGLSILDYNNDSWKHYNKANSKMPNNMVRDIEVDNNGVIWMATNNGLVKMKGSEIEPIFFRNGAYKNVVMDIAIDNNTIWVATNFGLIKILQ